MAKRKNAEPEEKILDVDASMQGTISFKDPVNLRINGSFEGKLETRGVLSIGENAKVKANIMGDKIVIAGKVNGDLFGLKSVSIVAPAVVRGNIRSPKLSIGEGAVIDGNVSMSAAMDEAEEALGASDLMNLKEVAQYLEVENKIVEEWANQKKIPGFQDGGAWKFRKSEIDAWVQEERVKV